MHCLHARTLPHLAVDTIHILSVAQDHLDPDLRQAARLTIMSLRNADTTNSDEAAAMLRGTAHHLRDIETCLEAADRPFTARKVRGVRERVACL
jgi:hypothetical protein